MISRQKFDDIKRKYEEAGSWAVWAEVGEKPKSNIGDITAALVNVHKRGVKVQVILDKSNLTGDYSSADFLAHSGIQTLIDSEHAIAHNKVVIIDSSTVITGSFNFTKAAETSNAENVLVVLDKKLANDYANNWREHAKHSTKYEGR